MTTPAQSTPPAASSPPSAAPPQPAVASLSRDLADFLVELSITLNKHAIYPQNHPLLDVAVDGVANRLGMLFVGERDSLSIGVARRQLIIEGVATDPLNPVLKELAQRLHQHHVGALKLTRGITRDELAAALAALSVDPTRSTPIGRDTERLGALWAHVRFFPLTYDRLQLIEDDPGDAPSTDKMLAGRATQLWIGLARAALVSDATASEKKKTDSDTDDDSSLEPATVARAIDEHQREEAYDQVIVGYLLQIGEELKTAEGPEAAGLQRRVSHLVGSLKQSTLERLLEMGGDKVQRRKFLLDASQGVTVEAVMDLVKAASAAEGQTVSHSMLRMLSKLAHHPSSKTQRGKTDPSIRDVMRRLVDDWTLEDPNPDAYRQALENIASLKNISEKPADGAHPIDVEPERIIQIAVEIGAIGPQVHMAMEQLQRSGRIDTLLDLVERAPSPGAAAPIWDFLVEQGAFETLLTQQRLDLPLITRFVKRLGAGAAPTLLAATVMIEEAKTRSQLYDLLLATGDSVGGEIARRLPGASPTVQRELLALIAKLSTMPPGFSAHAYLESDEPLVRREAVRLLLRNTSDRDETIVAALTDPDDRVVFAGLSAAQDKCPTIGINLLKQRVDRGELDSQLRTMGIRIIGQTRTPDALEWLLPYVMTETNWSRRPKLRPSSPEMLAALSMIATHWRSHPDAETVLRLAEQSKDPEVRAKLTRTRSATATADSKHE